MTIVDVTSLGSAETAPVDVVICCYTEERWEDVLAAVVSCRTQQPAPEGIIIVVDHNPLLAKRLATTLKDVLVVENDEQSGLSGARNTGIRHARAEIVAFLDDDARACPGWIAGMMSTYSDKDVVGVGGTARPAWPEEAPGWFPLEFGWVVGCSYIGLPLSAAPVRNLLGCNMSFRRSVFSIAGDFRAELGRIGKRPAGCEETEFCIRVRRTTPGAKIVFDQSVAVDHRVTIDRTAWRYFANRCWSEGLSKAVVATISGTEAGLSSERDYVTRVLPVGVLRNLWQSARHRETAGVLRAAAIIGGLVLTVGGYAIGTVRQFFRHPSKPKQPVSPRVSLLSEAPMRSLIVDLSEEMQDLSPERDGGVPYIAARVLVTDDGRTLGMLEIPFAGRSVSGAELEAQCREVLGGQSGHGHIGVDDRLLEPATVVVPTMFARPEQLEQCVRSLLELDYPRYEVIVVDNRPIHDERGPTPTWADDERVRVVREPRPGASAARNSGLAAATTGIIAYTDDDSVVDRRWLRALAERLITEPDVDCVTGLVIPAALETSAQVWFERFGGFDKGYAPRIFRLADNPTHSSLYPYAAGAFGSGNNVAFRASTLRSLGGYNETLGPGTPAKAGEDLALFISVICSGLSIAYEPSAIVQHEHRRTYGELSSQVHDYGIGLSAMMVSLSRHDPRHLLRILRRLPAGGRLLFSPRSDRNVKRTPDYPKDLLRAEAIGMMQGPFAYLRSVRMASVRAVEEAK